MDPSALLIFPQFDCSYLWVGRGCPANGGSTGFGCFQSNYGYCNGMYVDVPTASVTQFYILVGSYYSSTIGSYALQWTYTPPTPRCVLQKAIVPMFCYLRTYTSVALHDCISSETTLYFPVLLLFVQPHALPQPHEQRHSIADLQHHCQQLCHVNIHSDHRSQCKQDRNQ